MSFVKLFDCLNDREFVDNLEMQNFVFSWILWFK